MLNVVLFGAPGCGKGTQSELLEKKFGRRPIIFLSNGFDTRIWDDKFYPERRVASTSEP